MNAENVIFDLDGTLIDSSAGIEYSARAAVARVLPGARLPSLRPFIGPPLREVFRLALREMPGLVARKLEELEREFRASYDIAGWRMSVAYDGAASTLAALSRQPARCFVVTNKPAFSAVSILRELGLSHWLSDIVSPDSRKPAFACKADAVEYLLDRHAIDPRSAVLVGDSRDDADAARCNGIAFIAATYGYGLSDSSAHDAVAKIATLPELPAAIDHLDMSTAETPEIRHFQGAMS